jgi:hypothetical protein
VKTINHPPYCLTWFPLPGSSVIHHIANRNYKGCVEVNHQKQ